MVDGVGSARSGSVVPRRLVGEGRECKAVRVEQRRREAPLLSISAGRRILVFDALYVAEVPAAGDVSNQNAMWKLKMESTHSSHFEPARHTCAKKIS